MRIERMVEGPCRRAPVWLALLLVAAMLFDRSTAAGTATVSRSTSLSITSSTSFTNSPSGSLTWSQSRSPSPSMSSSMSRSVTSGELTLSSSPTPSLSCESATPSLTASIGTASLTSSLTPSRGSVSVSLTITRSESQHSPSASASGTASVTWSLSTTASSTASHPSGSASCTASATPSATRSRSQGSGSHSQSSNASLSTSVSLSASVSLSPSVTASHRSPTCTVSSSSVVSSSSSKSSTVQSPSATHTPSRTVTRIRTGSQSKSVSWSGSFSQGSLSEDPTSSASLTRSGESLSSSPSQTPSTTRSLSITTSHGTQTRSVSPSDSTTTSASRSASPSDALSASLPSPSPSGDTPSPSSSGSMSPSITGTITPPPTPTPTASASVTDGTASEQPTSTSTATHSVSPSMSWTASPSRSVSPSASWSADVSSSTSPTGGSATLVATSTRTSSASASYDGASASTSATTTGSPSNTPSPSVSGSPTGASPSNEASLTVSLSHSASLSATDSATITDSETGTASDSLVASLSTSASASPSPSESPSQSQTVTSSTTDVGSASASLTDVYTNTVASDTLSSSTSFTTSLILTLSLASDTTSRTDTSSASPTNSLSWSGHTETLDGSLSRSLSVSASMPMSSSTSLSLSTTPTATAMHSSSQSLTTTSSMTPSSTHSDTYSDARSSTMASVSTSSTASASPSETWTDDPSSSASQSASMSGTISWSRSSTVSATGSASTEPSVTQSKSQSTTATSSLSDVASASDSGSSSASESTSASTSTSISVSRRSSTRSVTNTRSLTTSADPCNTTYFENNTDVFHEISIDNRVPGSVASPDGNQSSVFYQLGRVEFGQLGSLVITFRLATPLRNEYGKTRLDWSPIPSISNCKLSNYSIVDAFTIRLGLSYIANERIGTGDTYLCNITFNNDAFQCQQLTRGRYNVSASLRVLGTGDDSFGANLLRVLGTIAGILSGGAALLHQSRANSINSFADCQFSLVDPVSFGDSPLQFGLGTTVGYYLRGAVVGNACFFLMVVVAHGSVVGLLTLRAYYKDYYDPMHPPLASIGLAGDTDGRPTGKGGDDSTDEEDAAAAKKKAEAQQCAKISRSQFSLRHELQHQASIARFPSASVAAAVLTYDGTCTAAMALIMHPQMSMDVPLGVLGLVMSASFIVVLFVVTHALFHCEAQKLSRHYADVDTPTDEEEGAEADDGGGVSKKGNALPVVPGQHHNDVDPPPPPRGRPPPLPSAPTAEPPSAIRRLSMWLFNPRMKWLRMDRHPYFKGMYLSLFEDYTLAPFACAEVGLSLIVAVASGVMISEREVCNGLAGLSLTCVFLFIAVILYLNPYINRMDLFHALTANSCAFLGAILLFIYSRQDVPDESLANAATNLATMVSVVNVLKFLTDIFGKGKKFRELFGLEAKQRLRASKKKHLKVLKRAITKSHLDRSTMSDAASDASGATHGALGRRNFDLDSSWGEGGDEDPQRMAAFLELGLSTSSRRAPPLPLATAGEDDGGGRAQWSLVIPHDGPADGHRTPPPRLPVPATSLDNTASAPVPAVGVRVAPLAVPTYRPPPPAATTSSLDALQQRLARSNLHRLAGKSRVADGRRWRGIGSDDGRSTTAYSLASAMDEDHNVDATPSGQDSLHDITADEIEHCMRVEHVVRQDSKWFGGIVGAEASSSAGAAGALNDSAFDVEDPFDLPPSSRQATSRASTEVVPHRTERRIAAAGSFMGKGEGAAARARSPYEIPKGIIDLL